MMTDPIADMLTRIRNGQRAGKKTVSVPASKRHANILDVLQREGYIVGHKTEEVRKGISNLVVELKYFEGDAVIQEIDRVSKPGRRVYSNVSDMPRVHNGLGISILSTSKGVMSDFEARQSKVGGEVICTVF